MERGGIVLEYLLSLTYIETTLVEFCWKCLFGWG